MNSARSHVLLVAENIALAKLLSSNNKKIRDVGMKRLGKWLSARSQDLADSYNDKFMSIWKGLFYAMWFADKFLIQEELAEKIGELIIHCKKKCMAIPFIKGFFDTMMMEWHGIDQFRYDKFLMLIRRFLRHIFNYCKINEWNPDLVREISEIFRETVLCVKRDPPLSLSLHFSEVYLQELSKIGNGNIAEETVEIFLLPFVTYISQQTNSSARITVSQNIFRYLINQSDVGIEFHEKVTAWKQSHFPGSSWDDMEKVNDDGAESGDGSPEGENKNEHLDPRAGRLDVELPPIYFNPQAIAYALENESAINSKCRAALRKLASEFETLANGIFPRVEKEALKIISSKNLKKTNLEKAAKKLDELTTKFVLKKSVGRAAQRLINFECRLNKKRAKKRSQKKKANEISVAKETRNSFAMLPSIIDTNMQLSKINETNQDNSKRSAKTDQECLKKEEKHETKSSTLSENILSKENEHQLKRKIMSEEHIEGISVKRKFKVSSAHFSPSQRKKHAFPSKVQSGMPGKGESSGNWEVTEISSTPEIKNIKCVSTYGKKVTISLNRNGEQDVKEYHLAVSRSPQIPYDASKRPSHGLLKPNLPKGPINPFYKLIKKSHL